MSTENFNIPFRPVVSEKMKEYHRKHNKERFQKMSKKEKEELAKRNQSHSQKGWDKLSPEERNKRVKETTDALHGKMNIDDKIEHGLKISKGKKNGYHPTRGKSLPKQWNEKNSTGVKKFFQQSGLIPGIKRKICTPKGTFESVAQAVKIIGISDQTIRRYTKTKPNEWYYIDYEGPFTREHSRIQVAVKPPNKDWIQFNGITEAVKHYNYGQMGNYFPADGSIKTMQLGKWAGWSFKRETK